VILAIICPICVPKSAPKLKGKTTSGCQRTKIHQTLQSNHIKLHAKARHLIVYETTIYIPHIYNVYSTDNNETSKGSIGNHLPRDRCFSWVRFRKCIIHRWPAKKKKQCDETENMFGSYRLPNDLTTSPSKFDARTQQMNLNMFPTYFEEFLHE